MAKQSPTDPKFRCNVCKEYFFAPEHLVYYQCPNHGILCKEHAFSKDNMKFFAQLFNTTGEAGKFYTDAYMNYNKYYKTGLIDDAIFKKTFKVNFDAPIDYLDKCKVISTLSKEDFIQKGIPRIVKENENKYSWPILLKDFQLMTPKEKMKKIIYQPCSKKVLKFEWSENLGRWLEFGKEKESDYVKTSKTTNANSANSEIRLLVELFSKNILSKEEFIEQILNKI